jgi:hypothetical protein
MFKREWKSSINRVVSPVPGSVPDSPQRGTNSPDMSKPLPLTPLNASVVLICYPTNMDEFSGKPRKYINADMMTLDLTAF